jgi:hypothetical protein
VKLAISVIVMITAMIAPASAQEKTIVRRAPACIEQEYVVEFYKLSRQNPSMGQLAEFLRTHQCIALNSGDRVKIEKEDMQGPQDRCYWVRHAAFKR